jgi:hypothetical protein
MTDIATALLEAHIRYELERLTGSRLDIVIREGVSATLAWLDEVSFNEVVTREQILRVIDLYVINLKVSGGITELAGEMSNVVFSSEASTATRIDEVLPTEAFEDFADKVASLESAQRELLRYVTESAAVRTLAARVVLRAVTELFSRGGEHLGPRLKSLFGKLEERLSPALKGRVGAAVSTYVEAQSESLAREGSRRLLEVIEPEWVRQMADEIWDEIATKPIGDAAHVFTAQDLEDFVVLGYEYWMKFRKTRYFRTVSTEVVHRLFDKYGSESVRSVVSDMGISPAMIENELLSFVPRVVDHARRTGFLEAQLRAYLEPFYRSAEVADVLGRSG